MRLIMSLVLLIFAFAASQGGCGANSAENVDNVGDGLRKVTIRVDQVPLEVEVADDEASRARGYMFRDPPSDGGILFVFPAERRLSFWMKNVGFDLDIAFIDSGGRIDQIERMHAWRQSLVHSRRPAKYALEVPAGWFASQGIQHGDTVRIPPEVKARE